jgi:hypothetical protein
MLGALLFAVMGAATDTCNPQANCTRRLGAQAYVLRYLLPPEYDNSVHPGIACQGISNGSTKVEAQIYIHSLNEVNQKKKEVTMSAYLRTWWTDSRLAYEPSTAAGCFDNPIILKTEHHNKVWEPNLYIPNLVDAEWLGDLSIYIQMAKFGNLSRSSSKQTAGSPSSRCPSTVTIARLSWRPTLLALNPYVSLPRRV